MDEYEGKHEAETPDESTGTPPGIKPEQRTVIYIVCLAVELLTLLITGAGVIFGLMSFEQASQISALVFVALGLLNSSLSVGYRPTRPGAIQ